MHERCEGDVCDLCDWMIVQSCRGVVGRGSGHRQRLPFLIKLSASSSSQQALTWLGYYQYPDPIAPQTHCHCERGQPVITVIIGVHTSLVQVICRARPGLFSPPGCPRKAFSRARSSGEPRYTQHDGEGTAPSKRGVTRKVKAWDPGRGPSTF